MTEYEPTYYENKLADIKRTFNSLKLELGTLTLTRVPYIHIIPNT